MTINEYQTVKISSYSISSIPMTILAYESVTIRTLIFPINLILKFPPKNQENTQNLMFGIGNEPLSPTVTMSHGSEFIYSGSALRKHEGPF